MGETALGSFYPYPNIKVTTMIVGRLLIVKLFLCVSCYCFGGSYLGSKAVIDALSTPFQKPNELEVIFAGYFVSSFYPLKPYFDSFRRVTIIMGLFCNLYLQNYQFFR